MGQVSNHPIDPRLLPRIPEDEDEDDDVSDLDAPTTSKIRSLQPATKIGGVRQKDKKGKKRSRSSDSDAGDSDAAPAPKQRGRPKGSPNFSGSDISRLLDIVSQRLPLGSKGWKEVTKGHNRWAKESDRPVRNAKSLEAKFKQLAGMKKPTGSGNCPPEVKGAKRIEDAITARAGTRNVNDSEFDGNSSDNSVEILTAVARRAPTPPLRRSSPSHRRNSRLNAPELVNTLAKAFDPEAQQSRDDERSQRSFQTTQFFSLSQQLRDAHAATESLRNQLIAMQSRMYDVERARDRAEWKLEMYGSGSRAKYIAEECPDLVRVGGKIRSERVYPDGGRCIEWFTDISADDDSEKENWDPSSSSSSGHPSLPSSSSALNSSFEMTFDTSADSADGRPSSSATTNVLSSTANN
ncbi:hypothetical protein K438DRAFT_1847299 [Mycena galopus ATCC 62051]|nr:hypothetical protein K438DRAFT_1847299 [Mycena galopus ATCC 62051]